MKALLLILTILLFVTCKKDNLNSTTITYKLECEKCLLTISDELTADNFFIVNDLMEKQFPIPAGFTSTVRIFTTQGQIPFTLTTFTNGKLLKTTRGVVTAFVDFNETLVIK